MPRNPAPIHPRVSHARAWEGALRAAYLAPFGRAMLRRLAQAESANQAWRAMDDVVEAMVAQPRAGVPVHLIQNQLDSIKGYHRKKVIASFRSALALDITPVLSEPEIGVFMAQKLNENVDLIKTIPTRLHAGLKGALERELQQAPFDQQRLKELFAKQYKSSGYNLRRIVRDQNSKAVAGLTEIRQRQLGIGEYQWLTSQDERVRPTHEANSGRKFQWANPPAETGHPGDDIQCRCVAIPIVTEADRQRLKDADAHSTTTIGPGRPARAAPGAPPVASPPTPPAAPFQAPRPPVSPMVARRDLPAHNRSRLELQEEKIQASIDSVKEDIARYGEVGGFHSKTLGELEGRMESLRGVRQTIKERALVADLGEALQDTFSEGRTAQYMAIKATNLRKVLKDGQFKSSAETGKGTFKVIAEDRFKRIEQGVFNLADDAMDIDKIDELPKYGFMAGRERMDFDPIVGHGYGETFVRFKPEVRQRSTVTLGDSFDGNSGPRLTPASPLNDVADDLPTNFFNYLGPNEDLQVRIQNKKHWRKWGETRDYKDLMMAARGQPYVETQIYGRLGLDDVDAILVESKKVKAELRKRLDKMGLADIKVEASGHHTKLHQIAHGYSEAMQSLSPTDIDALGDYYIERLFNAGPAQGLLAKGWDGKITGPVAPLRNEIKALGSEATTAQKRAYLRAYYEARALKADSGLPKVHWEDYRPTQADFTDDVLDTSLLERYPGA